MDKIDWTKPIKIGIKNVAKHLWSPAEVVSMGAEQVCARLQTGSLMLLDKETGFCGEYCFYEYRAMNIQEKQKINWNRELRLWNRITKTCKPVTHVWAVDRGSTEKYYAIGTPDGQFVMVDILTGICVHDENVYVEEKRYEESKKNCTCGTHMGKCCSDCDGSKCQFWRNHREC